MGRLTGDKLLCLKQGDLGAVLLQEPEQVLGFEPYGGGIVIGVYTDQAGALQKGLIQPEGYLVFPVIEQAQRCHRAGNQAKHVHQILIRGKGKRPGVVLLPEGFQVDSLVSLDRNEIVIALFVVPDEEVLGIGLWVGQVDLRHLRHVENGFMLRHLMPDVSGAEEGVNLLLVHICCPPVVQPGLSSTGVLLCRVKGDPLDCTGPSRSERSYDVYALRQKTASDVQI